MLFICTCNPKAIIIHKLIITDLFQYLVGKIIWGTTKLVKFETLANFQKVQFPKWLLKKIFSVLGQYANAYPVEWSSTLGRASIL